MTAIIHKLKKNYYGHDILKPSCENFGLLRILGQNGEPADQVTFRKHHHKCAMLLLNRSSMPFKNRLDIPFKYYTPENLFSNWADFPDLAEVPLICWDADAVSNEIKAQIRERSLVGVCNGTQKPTKRVDILLDAHPDEMVAIYAPYNHIPTLHGILKLKAHYVSDDRSWRCSISVIDSVREAFPSPEYHHSEEFLRQFESIDCGF